MLMHKLVFFFSKQILGTAGVFGMSLVRSVKCTYLVASVYVYSDIKHAECGGLCSFRMNTIIALF